jgi:prevent-host-death family protein
MVHRVGSFEAKTRLAELLRLAERGDEIVVLRRGQRIAVIVGARRYDDLREPAGQDWQQRLRAWRERKDRPRLSHDEVMGMVRESKRGMR